MTIQEAVNKWRIQLGETDQLNSRWDDDPHGLFYINLGRREWAKESKALKALFERTTAIGATVGLLARYTLDPRVFKVDEIFWDGEDNEVELVGPGEWSEHLAGQVTDKQGIPLIYRLKGDVVDIWPTPPEAKTLAIYASIIPADVTSLTVPEPDLNDDQMQGAIDYATLRALTDDDRDGTIYENKFLAHARSYRLEKNKRGPRRVNQLYTRRWPV